MTRLMTLSYLGLRGTASRRSVRVVVNVEAKNLYHEPVFSFVACDFASLSAMMQEMAFERPFLPEDFGDVVEAGMGHLPESLAQRLRLELSLVPTQVAKPAEATGTK